MDIELLVYIAKFVVVLGGLLSVVPIMLFVERRGSALMQNRLGPNRLGPLGFFQTIADVIKFLFKEDRALGHVKTFYFILAPWLSVVPVFMTFAVIPFGDFIQIGEQSFQLVLADLDVGLLYVFSIASLGVYGVMMAGWASNNKYSLLGALRSSAQMISYELSLGLSIVGILLIFSSFKLTDIAVAQGELLFSLGPIDIPKWGIFLQPIGFILFLVSIFAETNRLPFDLPEGESELIAGYHLEYGSFKFALFMLAEYTHMAVGSALISTLFLGGWQLLPGFGFLHQLLFVGAEQQIAAWGLVVFQAISFVLKIAFFMWLFVWVRWSIPRFRFDQLMVFGWKVMFPLALLNVVVTAILVAKGVF